MPSDKPGRKSHILKLFSSHAVAILERKGLSQIDLARGIGADARNVSRWLNAKATPNLIWAVRIANYLEVSLDELCGRETPGLNQLKEIRDLAQKIATLSEGTAGPNPS